MKTNINNLILLGAAVLLTACSSKDLFDENAVENNTKASYAENFAKKYVNIDMNQSWDYSHKQSDFRLVGTSKGQKAMQERAALPKETGMRWTTTRSPGCRRLWRKEPTTAVWAILSI